MARADLKLQHLQSVRLFSACNKRELGKLARVTDEVNVEAGHVLTEEGKTGHEFFLILDGKAVVKKRGRKVAVLGPGDQFGEIALLDRGPRTATIVAETPMSLLVLGQREFAGVLDEVPPIAHKLLTILAGSLRELDTKGLW